MPLRGFRSVSFLEDKKTPSEPCILCGVRTIEEPSRKPLPRAQSDLSNRKITVIRTDSTDSDCSNTRMTPPPTFDKNGSDKLPEEVDSNSLLFMAPIKSSSLDQESLSASDDSLDDVLGTIPPEVSQPFVIRRLKGKPSDTQKRMHRHGVVWSADENNKSGSDLISNPILVSHPSLRIGNEPRSTEEQQDLLRKLAESQISSAPPKTGGDTNNNGPRSKQVRRAFTLERLRDSSSKSRPPISGSKMATRIQRTIKALYDSRRSFEKLEEECRSSEDELTDEEHLDTDRFVL